MRSRHTQGCLFDFEAFQDAGFALPSITWPSRKIAWRKFPFLILGDSNGASRPAQASPLHGDVGSKYWCDSHPEVTSKRGEIGG